MDFKNTYHRNGEVTYWSVYQQVWLRTRAASISDRELAAMSFEERARVLRHAERFARRSS